MRDGEEGVRMMNVFIRAVSRERKEHLLCLPLTLCECLMMPVITRLNSVCFKVLAVQLNKNILNIYLELSRVTPLGGAEIMEPFKTHL